MTSTPGTPATPATATPAPAPADDLRTQLDAVFQANQAYLAGTADNKAKRDKKQQEFDQLLADRAQLAALIRYYGELLDKTDRRLTKRARKLGIDLEEEHGITPLLDAEDDAPKAKEQGSRKGLLNLNLSRFDHSRRH